VATQGSRTKSPRTAATTRPKATTKTQRATTTRRTAPSSVDAITLLKADHREVEKLFKAFEKSGDRAYRSKRKLVDSMISDLSQHAAIEEQFFYPAARRAAPEFTDDVLEGIEEHHIVKWLLSELVHLDPKNERFDAKVTVLMENVRHHVEEEEHDLFPEIRRAMGRKGLSELGAKLQEGKKLAPTRPHPRSPDEPPGNLIVGAVAGVIDRARTAATSRA
jgi:hemerythrin superfamily protein